jgi:MoxR-like ATPase
MSEPSSGIDKSAEAVERLKIALYSARQTHSGVRVEPKALEAVLSAFEAKAERDALQDKLDEAVEAMNQSRLAFAGYVSAQSAVDVLDATITKLKGETDE